MSKWRYFLTSNHSTMKKPLITSNDDLNERKLNNESKKLQCSLKTIQYKLYSCFRTDIISIREISLKKISLKSINYFRSHTIGLNASRDLYVPPTLGNV